MAYGFTYTLPTITGSHSDFPVLMRGSDFPSTAIDGTSNAIDDGGGNLRAYTSDTKITQLAVEVVSFISSGSPSAEVWVSIPTAATGNTIFIEADSVETSQPASGSTYGSEAVWSGDEAIYHCDSTLDSTGNGNTLTLGSEITQNSDSFEFSAANSNSKITHTQIDLATGYFILKFNPTTTGNGIILGHSTNTQNWSGPFDGGYQCNTGSSNTPIPIPASGVNYYAVVSSIGGTANVELFDSSGVSEGVETASNIPGWHPNMLGDYTEGGGVRFSGKVFEYQLSTTAESQSYLDTKIDNMSSSSNWGSVGTWADSSSEPTADCYIGFIGTITDPALYPCGFIGSISDENGFIGIIEEIDRGFIGSISDTNGFNGSICDD